MNEGLLAGNLIVPQVQVSPLGTHSHSGGVSGMPLQAGDPAVEGAGGAVEVIRRQRANVRLLKTLQREQSQITYFARRHQVEVYRQYMTVQYYNIPLEHILAKMRPQTFSRHNKQFTIFC